MSYNTSIGAVSAQRYTPYGAPRGPASTLPTDYKFTGQRSEETGLGSLYDYNARFYSPILGRFLSPDTLVPSPGNPQSLNRYAYVLNNPLRYTDSTGHCGPLTPVCLGLLLSGIALLLQGDSPDLNVTPEDIASQRLGGALLVSGATLATGGALAGTVGAARAGTTATTAACADGDCTNEVRGAGQVVQNAVQQIPPQTIKQTAYEIARAGGRHSGTLRTYAARSSAEVQRGINSLQKISQLHTEKIANPAKYIADWSAKSPEEQQRIIDFWHKEMLNYQQQAEVLMGLLQDALGGQ